MSTEITATKYHDICAGHRVVGHEGKCRHLHGHNYRIHFHCAPEVELDDLGRVVDFSVIGSQLCQWVEEHWDHKFLHWDEDTLIQGIRFAINTMDNLSTSDDDHFFDSFVTVPFNPTAENMALYLRDVIGPQQLKGTGAKLIEVTIEETRKCSVSTGKCHAQ